MTMDLLLSITVGIFIIILIAAFYYKSKSRAFEIKRKPAIKDFNVEDKLIFTQKSEVTSISQDKEIGSNDGIIGEVKVRYAEESQVFSKEEIQSQNITMPTGLIVLHVMALPGSIFLGYTLLQSLLTVGFRFGEMNIFHRHEQLTGQGKILFSLASATEPGTFNLNDIGSLSCVGLSLFMHTDKVDDPEQTFNLLLNTAYLLAEDLGGKVLDEHFQELSENNNIMV
ncbi:MAG: Cell division protein ZipA [Legionellaceae bacterium]